MRTPTTFATITRIDPPGSRLTRAGKPLAIGDRVTSADALTLATPDGRGGCVSMTAQIGVSVATSRLPPVEAPARMGLVFDDPAASAPTIEAATETPRAPVLGLGSGGPIAVKADV